jgi:iron complex transport system permease protein
MVIDAVTPRRLRVSILVSAAVMLVAAVIAPLAGSSDLDLAAAFRGVEPHRTIFFNLRLPRVLLGLLTGGALSVAGVVFQALLRDALATPYTLGISSGASLGAVLAICFGVPTVLGLPGVWGAAFIGSVLTLALVLGIASERNRMSSFTLLLAGVTLNSIAMALIMLLHNLATFGQSFAITQWLMGRLDAMDFSTLGWLSALVLGSVVWMFALAPQWNLMAVGEEWAAARGASPARLLLIGSIAGSLLTAAVTALTGPIGFVGLIVPHALRLRLGADHRLLLPCSFFLGAAFLTLCDTLARTMLRPAEIPVGVITALLGGPFFIYLLRGSKRRTWL